MRLAEAASILGVHQDIPIETLKQTYRRYIISIFPFTTKSFFLFFSPLVSASVQSYPHSSSFIHSLLIHCSCVMKARISMAS